MVAESTQDRREVPLETLLKAKRDYLLGKGPISSIAKAYDLNEKSLRTRAVTEKWSTIRQQYARYEPVLKLIDQIQDLDTKIDACDEPKDIDSLYRAKQRALSMLWGITGHPKPPVAERPKPANKAREAMLRKLASKDKDDEPVQQPANQSNTAYWNYEGC